MVCAARFVVETVIRAVQAGDVCVGGGLLISRHVEVVAEASTRGKSLDSNFWVDVGRGAYRRELGAGSREVGKESILVRAIVSIAGTAGSELSVTSTSPLSV